MNDEFFSSYWVPAIFIVAAIASNVVGMLFLAPAVSAPSLPELSRQLALDVPSDAVVWGAYAPALCLETGLKCVPTFKGYHDETPIEDFGVTHLLVDEEKDGVALDAAYDDWRQRFKKIKTYRLGKSFVDLYEVVE